MKRWIVMLLIGLFGATAFGADAAPSPAWQRYEIVVQRNMFSPRRQPPKPERSTSDDTEKTAESNASADDARESAPPLPGENYVLVGTSLVGEHRIAFCEDRRDGRLIRLTPGEAVEDFSLKQVTQDAVVFEREAKPVNIAVGQTLSGQIAAPAAPSPGTTGAGQAATTSTNPPPAADAGDQASATDESTMSIIERLRRRREQELQR
ncbi:hypothetical protein HED60_24015 [Planctomycetales bacterium ZRK34]|nr:hypothetical protein HED60_24015 [Planctomycetales bacterium ZRK34]